MNVQLHCIEGKNVFNCYADFDWPVLFKILKKNMHKTDVQSLQFKQINRYIPSKENLYL